MSLDEKDSVFMRSLHALTWKPKKHCYRPHKIDLERINSTHPSDDLKQQITLIAASTDSDQKLRISLLQMIFQLRSQPEKSKVIGDTIEDLSIDG